MDLRLPNPLHTSLAQLNEHTLVDELLKSPVWRDTLHAIRGLPDNPCTLVRKALPHGFQGDVDILMFEPGRPDVATAIEVKRVKFDASAFEKDGDPNGLKKIKEGKHQANLLARVGFAQVYLYVLVAVDSRSHNEGRPTFAGLSSEQYALVSNAVTTAGLEPRVGLAILKLVQPMDHPPLTIGTSRVHLVHEATRLPQTPELTEWVTQLATEDPRA